MLILRLNNKTMQIISTNIAQPTTFTWMGEQITTGIYKKPTKKPIYLSKNGVVGDEVSDKEAHGDAFKACYMFSEDCYPYWKNLYPHLEWDYGMFGENLTVKGFDETKVLVGNIYKLGSALVEITQPREPCFKFGYKFGSQHVLKQFIKHGRPGTYLRVVEAGYVSVGDTFNLIETAKNSLTVSELTELIYAKNKDQNLLSKIEHNEAIPIKKRIDLLNYNQ